MEVTQGWSRQKTAHRTACWDCYRCHRACDGTRPCKRCVDLGRGFSCRDPASNERIPRKRKRSKSKERDKRVSITKQKGVFFIVDPQIFLSAKPPMVINNETCIAKTPQVIKNETCVASSSFTTISSEPSMYPTLPLDREMHESTQSSFGVTQREEILVFHKPHPRFSSVPDIDQSFNQLILDRPHPSSYLTPRQPTQITKYEETPSLEDFMEEIRVETVEVPDHRKTSASVFQSLSVPDDMLHLAESVFTPFGLRDSTQPFFVFKHAYIDRGMLAQVVQEPNNVDTICPVLQFFSLTASPSLCDLLQYSEEEIAGFHCAKILPSPMPLHADERPLLPYLYPQKTLRVSPVFKIHHFFYLRNGMMLHARSTLQFFYAADGFISFVILGVEKMAISSDTETPQSLLTAPPERNVTHVT